MTQKKAKQPLSNNRAALDLYDDPGAATADGARFSKAVPKGGVRSKKRGGSAYWTFLLCALILLCVLFYGWRLFQYTQFLHMRTAVNTSVFNPGTQVEGVDVSGMTLNDALQTWYERIEPAYAGRSVTLSTGQTVTAREMGYESDYQEVLKAAWRAQKEGTLNKRYEALQGGGTKGYAVSRVLYRRERISEWAQILANEMNRPVSEPSVSGFDETNLTFTFQEGSPGQMIDPEKLTDDVAAALDAGGGSVSVNVQTILPVHTASQIESLYGMRAYAVTNASSSSSGRLNNIRLALKAINGTVLNPGEEFSFNGTVGKRTADRGYRMAAAFSGGEVTEELGGGICQVSTTLFNAAVKSDLDITERHAHSMPVSYVDKGKDATVSWGAQDMRFVNTSDSPVYIVAYLDDAKKVRVGIFGLLIPNGEYITVEATVTETTPYETSYQVNAFFTNGQTNILQPGRDGYRAEAYKLRWTKDGTLISRTLLCRSNYPKKDEIIEIGPQ